MTKQAAITPYPYFTDTSGTALDGGKIYIGTAGLDPRTNPIAVYQDAANTIAWAQPLRTVSGYPTYQGAASNFYPSEGSFSILITDVNGANVTRNLNVVSVTEFAVQEAESAAIAAADAAIIPYVEEVTLLASSANSSATNAANSANAAAISAAFQRVLPTTPSAIPYEVKTITLGTAGTGASVSGEFALTVAGGPIGHTAFATVSGGSITSARIGNRGISTSATAPTYTLPTITGLTGATAPTATTGTIGAGDVFSAPTADGLSVGAWGNNAGSLATAPFGLTQLTMPLSAYLASITTRRRSYKPGIAIVGSNGKVKRIYANTEQRLAAVEAKTPSPRNPNQAFIFGDSRMDGLTTSHWSLASLNARNVLNQANALMGQRMELVGTLATSGQRTDQYLSDANISAGLATTAGVFPIFGVVNDISQYGGAYDYFSGPGYNGFAGVKAQCDKITTAGGIPLLFTDPGATVLTTKAQFEALNTYNRKIRQYGRAKAGKVLVFDYANIMVDGDASTSSSIALKSGYYIADGTHETNKGAEAAATALASLLSSVMPAAPADPISDIEAPVTNAVTISNASPAVVTWSGHPFKNGDIVRFTTTGALPTGLTAGTLYYVVNAGVTFQVSATLGGAAINTSSAGSGTHTVWGLTRSLFALLNPLFRTTTGGATNFGAVNPSNAPANWVITGATGTLTPTISNGSPTWTSAAHGYENGTPVQLATTGALPSGFASATTYYIVNKAANTFELSATVGGASITAGSAGSGTHTATLCKVGVNISPATSGESGNSITLALTCYYNGFASLNFSQDMLEFEYPGDTWIATGHALAAAGHSNYCGTMLTIESNRGGVTTTARCLNIDTSAYTVPLAAGAKDQTLRTGELVIQPGARGWFVYRYLPQFAGPGTATITFSLQSAFKKLAL